MACCCYVGENLCRCLFLRRKKRTCLQGWQTIYKYLQETLPPVLPPEDIDKNNFTVVQYKNLRLKIYGKIVVDEVLYTLVKWEYYHIERYATWMRFDNITEGVCFIQHQAAGTTYQYGLTETGPWNPLPSSAPFGDTIIGFSGLDDFSDVELFNGQYDLYLQVINENGGYMVQVARRINQADNLSRFDLSEPNAIRLVVDRNYYLKFDRGTTQIVADHTSGSPSNNPDFSFNITIYTD